MRKNVIRLALCATLFALSFPARAQQPTKIPRIGVFVTGARELDKLRQALRERGYVGDKNIQIVHRFVAENSDRMDKVIEEASTAQSRCPRRERHDGHSRREAGYANGSYSHDDYSGSGCDWSSR